MQGGQSKASVDSQTSSVESQAIAIASAMGRNRMLRTIVCMTGHERSLFFFFLDPALITLMS
jgi:hypothetical protein